LITAISSKEWELAWLYLPLTVFRLGIAATAANEVSKRLISIGSHLGFHPQKFFPTDEGVDHAMSPTLKGIEENRDDFTIFSNLHHGVDGGHSAVHSVHSVLSGVKKSEARSF